MKTCPACAEEVQDAAKICRHCGYDFLKRKIPKPLSQGDLAGCAITGCAAWIFWPVAVIILLAIVASFLPSTPPGGGQSHSAYPASDVQPGAINQAALDEMFPPEKKNRH